MANFSKPFGRTGGIRRGKFSRILSRAGLLAILWWSLNPQDIASWIIGVPVVLMGAWLGSLLTRTSLPLKIHPFGLLGFIPFFVLASVKGGIDVAWRSLHPRMPIDPLIRRYSLRLPEGTPSVFMATVLSLLPGTLSADIDESTLVIHMISDSESVTKGVLALEVKVAHLFGILLPEKEGFTK